MNTKLAFCILILCTSCAPKAQDFKVTSGNYSEREDLNQVVRNEFGSNYRVADWNEVVAYCQQHSAESFVNSIHMGLTEKNSVIVTYGGKSSWTQPGLGKRYYYITRFDHRLPKDYTYYSHANIDNHAIDLGSWTGMNFPVLCIGSGPANLPADRFRVTVAGPTEVLIRGEVIRIIGRVTTLTGRPERNRTVAVHDGVGLVSSSVRTGDDGSFSYLTHVNTGNAAVVSFVIDGEQHSFVFQAARRDGGTLRTNSLAISGVAFRNQTSHDMRVTLTAPGYSYSQRIRPNQSLRSLQTTPMGIGRVTRLVGLTFAIGLVAGGDLSVLVDEDEIAQVSLSLGAALVRGQIYATSEQDLGACWAPGADFGVTPASASGEVALCLGTDGFSLGASGEVGGPTLGVQWQIAEW